MPPDEPELIGALTRVKSYVDTGPFLAVQKAGAAALDQAEELVAPIRAELQRRRDAAVSALREAGFTVEPPKAAMYLWVPLPAGGGVGGVRQAGAGGDRCGGVAGQRVRPGRRGVLPDRADGRGPSGSGWRPNGWAGRSNACAEDRLRPPFELRLPKRRRWPWIAIAASVLLHSLLLFGWVGGRLPSVPRLPRQLIVLSDPSQGHEQVPMRYDLPQAPGSAGSGAPPGLGAEVRRADRLSGRSCARRVVAGPPRAGPAGAGAGRHRERPRRRPRRPRPDTARAWLRAGSGSRPLPLPPRELAQRLSKSRAELVDSAVTVIVQEYLDSIANDPATKNQGLPSWTTEIAGKKFGH